MVNVMNLYNGRNPFNELIQNRKKRTAFEHHVNVNGYAGHMIYELVQFLFCLQIHSIKLLLSNKSRKKANKLIQLRISDTVA